MVIWFGGGQRLYIVLEYRQEFMSHWLSTLLATKPDTVKIMQYDHITSMG